jgi:Amt family ammonium transporter
MFGYDDSLDAFGVHAVGGMIGAILTGVFATAFITGAKDPVGAIDGNWHQVLVQVYAVLATVIWDTVATFVILKVVDVIVGLRVSEDAERESLDVRLHGETVA